MRKTKRRADKPQGESFIEAARALGCDEDPTRFDEALKKVARHKPTAKKPEEAVDGKKRRAPSERP
jgi:hypothetical protein